MQFFKILLKSRLHFAEPSDKIQKAHFPKTSGLKYIFNLKFSFVLAVINFKNFYLYPALVRTSLMNISKDTFKISF